MQPEEEKITGNPDRRFPDKPVNFILQELKENPYRKFNIAFALLTIIPFLVFLYLIFARLPLKSILLSEVGVIATITIFIVLCGVYISYSIIRNILDRIIFYAAKAKQSEQRKSDFVATVSHELKAPLAIVKTNLFNIDSGIIGQINQEQKNALKYCDDAIEHMNNLISGLLNLYKLESGVWGRGRGLCDLGEIAHHEIREFQILSTEKKIKLQQERQEGTLLVWADENNLRCIINNLLSNAIKYTPEGGEVIFRVFSEGTWVRLECLDTGPGVAADNIPKLFRKFETLDITKEATGLGLFITKQIVEMLKGKIWVENRPEAGARFIVILPRDFRTTRENNHGRKVR